MNKAINVLESVLQELDMAEANSISIIYKTIKRNGEKHNSKELLCLAEIIYLWGKIPASELLEKLKQI